MPLGAPGCLVAIGWAVPPPGIIRFDTTWPEGSGRAKMNREFCKFKINNLNGPAVMHIE